MGDTIKRSYKPKDKENQRLKVALKKFAGTPEFNELPEEFKQHLNAKK
jgi:hypothetical protein